MALAGRTEDQLHGFDNGSGWRSQDLMLATESLYAATIWYLRQRVPANVLAELPMLR